MGARVGYHLLRHCDGFVDHYCSGRQNFTYSLRNTWGLVLVMIPCPRNSSHEAITSICTRMRIVFQGTSFDSGKTWYSECICGGKAVYLHYSHLFQRQTLPMKPKHTPYSITKAHSHSTPNPLTPKHPPSTSSSSSSSNSTPSTPPPPTPSSP